MATDNPIYPLDTDGDSTITLYGYDNQDSSYHVVMTVHNTTSNEPYVNIVDNAQLGGTLFSDRFNAKSDLGHMHTIPDIDGLNDRLLNTPTLDSVWEQDHVANLVSDLDAINTTLSGLATVASTGAYADLSGTPAARSSSTASHSLVTGTGATGFQVSSTRDAMVNYSVTVATTATIGGGADGTVVLEIASTNSATAGDWVEIARFRNGQAITLALILQSVQTIAGNLGGYIPAGYYAKLRTINNTGAPTYTYNSGQEVLL